MTVRVSGDETNVAIFRAHAGGAGELTFSDGRVFRLESANLVQPEWVWKGQDQLVVMFKGQHGVIKAGATVEIDPTVSAWPELSLLVLLGWYLILLHARDTTIVATGAIVASRVAVVR